MNTITKPQLNAFAGHLLCEEKADATVKKYCYDVERFADWLGERPLDRGAVLAYKEELVAHYAPASVNAAIASLRCYFDLCGQGEMKIKSLRIQRRIFAAADRELTRDEYGRLLDAAEREGNERLYLLMQTLCATGLRISELRCITVEATLRGVAEVRGKGKRRQVLLPTLLCHMLSQYIQERGIARGPVFVTAQGKPIDRSNVWSQMKRLCRAAGVAPTKVFPHNLRHLFARTYYQSERDIVRLADILGHESMNTTRIYTIESGTVHRSQIERLDLLRTPSGGTDLPHNAD